jgi:hypothetical protein
MILDRRQERLAFSVGPNWVGSTWRRIQNPVSETSCFFKYRKMYNVQSCDDLFVFRWLSPSKTISQRCQVATPETSCGQIRKPQSLRKRPDGWFGITIQSYGKLLLLMWRPCTTVETSVHCVTTTETNRVLVVKEMPYIVSIRRNITLDGVKASDTDVTCRFE